MKLSLDTSKNQTADALRNSQVRATDKGFDHVNMDWFKRCLSFSDMAEILEQSASKTHDAVLNLEQIKPTIEDKRAKIEIVGGKYDGTRWSLSDNSASQFGQLLGLSPSVIAAAEDNVEVDYMEKILKHRLSQKVKDKNKELFIRFRDGAVPTIRAFLTKKYFVIDHRWVLEQMGKFVPGGRISHFDQERFDTYEGDYCRYNVLIPDTIREEKDSGYGGGLNIGNSEIGTGRYSVRPMVFRHICWNGNIWNCAEGTAIQQVHRGDMDLRLLSAETMVCIHKQIPLINTNMDSFLSLQRKEFATEVNIIKLIGQLKNIKDVNLTYPQLGAILSAYAEEANLGNNAFSFLNAITRAAHNGQIFSLEQQDELESLAGNLTNQWITKPERWAAYCANAEDIKMDKILKALSA